MSNTFDQFDIDNRLLRALQKMNITIPTLIQEKVIQLALDGKDIIGKARTGSGKTIAYLLPLMNQILKQKHIAQSDNISPSIKALILVPTKELSEQVHGTVRSLSLYCSKEISSCNAAICDISDLQSQLSHQNGIDILISTPSKLLSPIERDLLPIKSGVFQSFVVDEADLVLSFGYEADVQKIVKYLSTSALSFQTFLLSATLGDEVDSLKRILRNPVTVKLEEGVDEKLNLTQYSIKCVEKDKFLLLFFILKLRLIQGKCIIFVRDIEQSYKVKLFLEQFSIKSCVLNSELPLNSRYNIVQEFNKGIYSYIIATDESDLAKGMDESEEQDSKAKNKSKKKKNMKRDSEYGVSRGVDFQDVEAVLNFDFPHSSRSYTHRVGRTARGHAHGIAISFVTDADRKICAKVEYKQKSRDCPLLPYEFDMSQVEGFRYRCEDALKSVTKVAVKEARLKEIKAEIFASEKLKTHFSDKPMDLKALRHDRASHPHRIQSHLKHIPDYLLPKGIPPRRIAVNDKEVTLKKRNFHKKNRKGKGKPKTNPLKSLKLSK